MGNISERRAGILKARLSPYLDVLGARRPAQAQVVMSFDSGAQDGLLEWVGTKI